MPAEIDRATYWEGRYQAGNDPWDLHEPAPGLMNWLAANPNRRGRVIVPGCGPGHDAVALAKHGFEVVAIDFAHSAIAATTQRAAEAGVALTALEADLFALPEALFGTADVVFEHTCFCALDPARRGDYRDVVARLLKPGGELVGVFFTFEDDGEAGPPFTTRPEALPGLMAPAFEAVTVEPVPNSHPSRAGEETFGVFRRTAP